MKPIVVIRTMVDVLWVLVEPTLNLPIRMPTAKTRRILTMLEPTMFPIASPESCF